MTNPVDNVIAYFTATNIKRYREQERVSLFQAKQAIADLIIDEALEHAKTAEDLIKIIRFQRRVKS